MESASFAQGRVSFTVQLFRVVFISLYLGGASSSSEVGMVKPVLLPPAGLHTELQLLDPYLRDQGHHHPQVVAEGKTGQKAGSQRYPSEPDKRSISYLPWNHNTIRELNANRSKYSEQLSVILVESGTSYLEIQWRLENSTGFPVAARPKFSRIQCHLGSTTQVHSVNGSVTQFRIENLLSNTLYTVCVELVPDTPPGAATAAGDAESSVDSLYYRCVYESTIPIIRTDSIVALVLTLGYVLLLTLIGYVTWWLRVRKIKTSRRAQTTGLEMSCKTGTNIEERAHLASNVHGQPNSH